MVNKILLAPSLNDSFAQDFNEDGVACFGLSVVETLNACDSFPDEEDERLNARTHFSMFDIESHGKKKVCCVDFESYKGKDFVMVYCYKLYNPGELPNEQLDKIVDASKSDQHKVVWFNNDKNKE